MRRVKFGEYINEHRAMARCIWLDDEGARSGSHRNVRRRPRTKEESEILTHLAKARLDRVRSTGELVILGPGRYRLCVFE